MVSAVKLFQSFQLVSEPRDEYASDPHPPKDPGKQSINKLKKLCQDLNTNIKEYLRKREQARWQQSSCTAVAKYGQTTSPPVVQIAELLLDNLQEKGVDSDGMSLDESSNFKETVEQKCSYKDMSGEVVSDSKGLLEIDFEEGSDVLRAQVEHIQNDRLMHLVDADMHDVTDAKERFDKACLAHDQECERCLSLKKGTKDDVVTVLEDELHSTRTAVDESQFSLIPATVEAMLDAQLYCFKKIYELLHHNQIDQKRRWSSKTTIMGNFFVFEVFLNDSSYKPYKPPWPPPTLRARSFLKGKGVVTALKCQFVHGAMIVKKTTYLRSVENDKLLGMTLSSSLEGPTSSEELLKGIRRLSGMVADVMGARAAG